MRGRWMGAGLVAALALGLPGPGPARAFCGFYVAGADAELVNAATMVVLMREGTTTVLSMQNDYQGPPEDFAMVVPVPVVLRRENVKTLPREVFTRVDQLAAPRLVEYWEQDPCPQNDEVVGFGGLGVIGHGGGGSGSGYGRGAGRPMVTVEAQFEVGEYDIVVLGARDSAALETWLHEHDYRIPDGAAAVLRPYVEEGMKFFVAKVDAERVRFEDGRARLSPLRVHYDDESFRLPVRLGLLNSPGTQDLVVHVLARNQRYELANYENVTIPTNLDVADEARSRFGELYAAIFDRTLEAHPGAVVTEYAWQATNCDPCPGPVLSEQDLATLGGDVILDEDARQTTLVPRAAAAPPTSRGPLAREIVHRIVRRHGNELTFCHQRGAAQRPQLQGLVGARFTIAPDGSVANVQRTSTTLGHAPTEQCILGAIRRWAFPVAEAETVVDLRVQLTLQSAPAGRWAPASPYQDFVLTRLHYRYGQSDLGEDLVFRAAPPIVGGREIPGEDGALEKGARPATHNNFQGRYAIRHPWEGAVECDNPVRGVWGGPPPGTDADGATQAASDTALAPRGQLRLPELLRQDVPSLGLVAGASADESEDEAPPVASVQPAAASGSGEGTGGCGSCAVGSPSATPAWALPLLVALAWRSRARMRR